MGASDGVIDALSKKWIGEICGITNQKNVSVMDSLMSVAQWYGVSSQVFHLTILQDILPGYEIFQNFSDPGHFFRPCLKYSNG